MTDLSSNELFEVKYNTNITFTKDISSATMKIFLVMCGAGSYWTEHFYYFFHNAWNNVASNYNGNGLSSGTYWIVSRTITVTLKDIKSGDIVSFCNNGDKTSSRLNSLTCIITEN